MNVPSSFDIGTATGQSESPPLTPSSRQATNDRMTNMQDSSRPGTAVAVSEDVTKQDTATNGRPQSDHNASMDLSLPDFSRSETVTEVTFDSSGILSAGEKVDPEATSGDVDDRKDVVAVDGQDAVGDADTKLLIHRGEDSDESEKEMEKIVRSKMEPEAWLKPPIADANYERKKSVLDSGPMRSKKSMLDNASPGSRKSTMDPPSVERKKAMLEPPAFVAVDSSGGLISELSSGSSRGRSDPPAIDGLPAPSLSRADNVLMRHNSPGAYSVEGGDESYIMPVPVAAPEENDRTGTDTTSRDILQSSTQALSVQSRSVSVQSPSSRAGWSAAANSHESETPTVLLAELVDETGRDSEFRRLQEMNETLLRQLREIELGRVAVPEASVIVPSQINTAEDTPPNIPTEQQPSKWPWQIWTLAGFVVVIAVLTSSLYGTQNYKRTPGVGLGAENVSDVPPSTAPSADLTVAPSVDDKSQPPSSMSNPPSATNSLGPTKHVLPSSYPSCVPSWVRSGAPAIAGSPSISPSKSIQPSQLPTHSLKPSFSPSKSYQPSNAPSKSLQPSDSPSKSLQPSDSPSKSFQPSSNPSISAQPTPTKQTPKPSQRPIVVAPTAPVSHPFPVPTSSATDPAPAPDYIPESEPAPAPVPAPVPFPVPVPVPWPVLEPLPVPVPTPKPFQEPDPTPPPTPPPVGPPKCFKDGDELRLAVNRYFAVPLPSSEVAQEYGWPIGSWCVGAVQDFSNLFAYKTKFNQDLSGWDMSSATTLNSMFNQALAFNSDIGGWNVANVVDMVGMFWQASAFNQDISSWDVSNVQDLSTAFFLAGSFNQNLCSWGPKLLNNQPSATRIFVLTSCPAMIAPDYSAEPPGPLCYVCS